MAMGDYMTVKELAASAGVTVRTVRRWIRSGRIPYRRGPGRRLRIYTEDARYLLSMSAEVALLSRAWGKMPEAERSAIVAKARLFGF